MAQADYEYGGMMASAWDLLRGDTSSWSDRPFYKALIEESGQPALDVGCGTGRLLLDYLQQGIDIDGVDNSPEMLALCGEKADKLGLHPSLYRQQMEDLDLPRKYRTIIVPSSSFQLLTGVQEARQALRRFMDHLEPRGLLVMPFMMIYTGEGPVHDWHLSGERVRDEDGLLIRRWSRATYDVDNQSESTEDRYELVRDGEVIASEHHRARLPPAGTPRNRRWLCIRTPASPTSGH